MRRALLIFGLVLVAQAFLPVRFTGASAATSDGVILSEAKDLTLAEVPRAKIRTATLNPANGARLRFFAAPRPFASRRLKAGRGSGQNDTDSSETLAQRVVDRIVARIEGDIITLSEVRELGRFQQLVEGKAAGEEELLRQLIDQWVVATEAAASRFPKPTNEEVKGELARLEKELGSPGAFRARLKELELDESAVGRLLGRQIWLSRYLDYKFRPAAQVEDAEIERYYREDLTAQLRARGQAAPPLDEVREQIRELLTQREISRRADRWLNESRPRLRIERDLGVKP